MIKVIYEDNHLLIVEKPPGLLTQPAEGSNDSLEDQAKQYIKVRYEKPGAVYLHAVHRLDRPVGGIVVFAKTSKALSRLNESQRGKGWRKVYQAEVEGIFKDKSGVLTHYLKHDDFKTLVSDKAQEDYKLSRLSYKVIEEKGNCSVLEIELVTGRYHQIRAQLSAAGHPIIGDQKYGSKQALPHIALKHTKLEFPHPITNNVVAVELADDKNL